jgi:hypothetical protein
VRGTALAPESGSLMLMAMAALPLAEMIVRIRKQ